MFVVITVYEELGTGNLTIKREVTDNGRAAKEAFCIYIMDPDCASCAVLDTTENNKYVLRYDQDRFE
jgi:hypothetical protein